MKSVNVFDNHASIIFSSLYGCACKLSRTQPRIRGLWMLIIVLSSVDPRFSADAQRIITCEVSAVQNAGKVVCIFPNDLNTTKQGFGLLEYEDDGRSAIVIACSWESSELVCGFEEGFSISGKVSAMVIVHTPSLKEQVKYACDTVPSKKNITVETCEIRPEVATVQPCWNATESNPCKTSSCAVAHTFLGILTVTVFVLIFFIIKIRRRARSLAKRMDSSEPEYGNMEVTHSPAETPSSSMVPFMSGDRKETMAQASQTETREKGATAGVNFRVPISAVPR